MGGTIDPRIHLGIDNCIAIKRWTTPMEWGTVIRNMGLRYVEAVPDLECEPLLTPDSYRQDYIREVQRMQDELGIKVVMCYSNNSTYDTIGFSHPDQRVRDRLVDVWFKKFIEMAATIGSDIGYYVQATPESMLYSKEGRKHAADLAFECMVRVNRMAGKAGIPHVALEQMYTPHQPPFTIDGMRKAMLEVTKESGVPLYVTEDVGHHCPHYMKPTADQLQHACKRYTEDGYIELWLGSLEAVELFKRFAGKGLMTSSEIEALEETFAENSDQFTAERDTDCYAWLSELGAWSPVIHLQQTDGTHSSHAPFLPDNNKKGIIHPVRILESLAECYARQSQSGMPPKCQDIYLIQELYLKTRDIGYQGLHTMKASTDYLRQYIPSDGMRLSELLQLNT